MSQSSAQQLGDQLFCGLFLQYMVLFQELCDFLLAQVQELADDLEFLLEEAEFGLSLRLSFRLSLVLE